VAGTNTRIYDHVNLYRCRIGRGSKIDAFVYIEEGVVIGNRVKIRPFTFVPTGVVIEDDVFIGPNVTFTNDKYPEVNSGWKLLKTTIRRGASIGGGSVLLPVTVGKNSLVGAGSVVTKDVPDNVVVAGNPASVIRGRSFRD
jgi:UDP-2-acetamido-3-amino-2,3-dideoxy-glucuronate N-acetyltransferase